MLITLVCQDTLFWLIKYVTVLFVYLSGLPLLSPTSPLLCSTHKRTKSCVNHTLMLLTCSFPRLLTRPPFPWLAICLRAAFCPLAQMGLKGRNANQPNLYQRQWGKKICQGPPPVKKDHVGMSVFHKNFR